MLPRCSTCDNRLSANRVYPHRPDDASQDAIVYFNVTTTNTSKTDSFKADVVVTHTLCGLRNDPSTDHLAGMGTEQRLLVDLDTDIHGVDGALEIPPGQSIMFKDGFSVACPDDVTYRIQPAGLAADTVYFHK